MLKKSISVMIVPHTEARVYNFRVPLFLLYLASISLLILLIALSLLMLDYHQVKRDVSYLSPLNEQLVQKNKQLESERGYQAQEINKLNKIMVRLKKFDDKLRIMTGLEVKGERINGSGKGGPDFEVNDSSWQQLKEELAVGIAKANQEKRYLNDVEVLKERALVRYKSFEELEDYLDSQKTQFSRTPSIWPMQGWIKQGFGSHISPFTGYEEDYNGIDIVARTGTPISAAADGRVVFAGKDGDMGLKVVIDHGGGYRTIYAHNYVNMVKTGERVKRGQVVATCGNSGRSTGPHLYYAVRVNGVYVDPMTYMLN